nr:MAG TPA: hypothetical protein [Caudoviricetes sp.]
MIKFNDSLFINFFSIWWNVFTFLVLYTRTYNFILIFLNFTKYY